ncbi:MAG: beta-glucosidase [Crocinitomicaceae bacterium TMED114]|nr:MAG: beta-glucosidase [Crocinitomicaceae bacterium TMED114]
MIKPVWTGRVAAVRWARASMLVLAIGLGSGAASAQLTDAQLMDSVQVHALKYFWDHAHPTSKLSRERIHLDNLAWDENTIAIGGTGFGFLNVIVGIENGHISATEGVTHLNTALDFLWNADRFHGAWPHWMEGNTGAVIPFSTFDDGGDLVETALLCQALICVREYFKDGNAAEQVVANKADVLWKGVEWSWYTQGEDVLYWHWSPNHDWQMNFQIRGYNEALMTYVLAAASPTFPISSSVYHEGWARGGDIVSSASQYGLPVVLGHNGAPGTVGPLFWAHYAYLGLDPHGLSDNYADYWEVVTNHTDIVFEHCVQNPNGFAGYGDNCWGLTASYTRNPDGSTGYAAHQPNCDTGVITPTAALSSMPYAPGPSMDFLRNLYEDADGQYLGADAQYVGALGPFDAFSPHYDWTTPRHLAIDQGTIGPMIENQKTHLFWDLFMGAPEIAQGLTQLGFVSTAHDLSSTCDVTACPGADYCGPGTAWDPVASACVVANPADINLDACVNVSDLLHVLSVFGQCFD